MSLITCRLNVLLDFLQEFRFIQINGEPHITDKNISVMQDLSAHENLDEIIDASGYFREIGNISEDKRHLEFEYKELKKMLTDFVEIFSGGRLLGANSPKLGKNNRNTEGYNIYGRLITKRKKWCSH